MDAIARPRKAKLEYSRWKRRPGERPLQLLLLLVFDFFSFSRVRGVPSTFYLLSASFPLSLPSFPCNPQIHSSSYVCGRSFQPDLAGCQEQKSSRTYLPDIAAMRRDDRTIEPDRACRWLTVDTQSHPNQIGFVQWIIQHVAKTGRNYIRDRWPRCCTRR